MQSSKTASKSTEYNKNFIAQLRQTSRLLVRELGMLQLSQGQTAHTHRGWHTMIEISQKPGITISELSSRLLLTLSATSRIVDQLIEGGYIQFETGMDKREKHLHLDNKGKHELTHIDDFSHARVKGALNYLSEAEQKEVLRGLQLYQQALERNRIDIESIKFHTLPNNRAIRSQIQNFIANIQIKEFSLKITPEINDCIARAEDVYHYNNSCNFWYAVNQEGQIVGSVGLKKINDTSCEMKKFFVHPNYRSKGIAQKLLAKLLTTAHKHKFTTLYFGTTSAYKAAHRFYEKNGFKRITKAELPKNFELCPVDSIFFKGSVRSLVESLSSN